MMRLKDSFVRFVESKSVEYIAVCNNVWRLSSDGLVPIFHVPAIQGFFHGAISSIQIAITVGLPYSLVRICKWLKRIYAVEAADKLRLLVEQIGLRGICQIACQYKGKIERDRIVDILRKGITADAFTVLSEQGCMPADVPATRATIGHTPPW